MKKFILLNVLLIYILSSSLQGMLNCQLCALITEYENTHQTIYDPISCLFCKEEVNSDLVSYELLKVKDQTFRIHDAQNLNCLALMQNLFTDNSGTVCAPCSAALSKLETKDAAPNDNDNDDDQISNCHLKCVSCCIAWLPCFLCYFLDECGYKECPHFYCDAWKEACCCKK